MKQQAASSKLNSTQIDFVYGVVKDMRTQQSDLQKQVQAQQIKSEDYGAALQQLQTETKKVLQDYLGADRFKQIQSYMGLP